MKSAKSIKVILKGQAKEEYELLLGIVTEQKKGRTNSEEMQLPKSINNKVAILKYNPAYGQNIPKN